MVLYSAGETDDVGCIPGSLATSREAHEPSLTRYYRADRPTWIVPPVSPPVWAAVRPLAPWPSWMMT